MTFRNTDKIWNVSNPTLAEKQLHKYYGKKIKLYRSHLPYKKYSVINPETGETVHFGHIRYEDYTKHQDEARRVRFRKRNRKWADAEKFTPAHLSYYVLW